MGSVAKLLPWTVALIAFATGGAFYASTLHFMPTGPDEPPLNFIAISDRLATAGQPSPAQLRMLHREGYGLVVNLATPGERGYVDDEGAILAEQGIGYLHLPVDFKRPHREDFAAFSAAMQRSNDKKTLVHCQMNMRASVFTFLYRVIYGGADIDEALESVHTVWVPNETWETFIKETLERHSIKYEPFALSRLH